MKLVAFLKRKEGMTREEFYEHWENSHAPLIANTPELARHIVRYEQLRRTTDEAWMGTPDFDGITLQWMESSAALKAFISEPLYSELILPDEAAFLDQSALVWMVTEEPLIQIEGPAA